jgi:predicted alpha/beta hydrolase family esterase
VSPVQPGLPMAALGAYLARESRETMRAGLLFPVASTAVGNRALLNILGMLDPEQPTSADRYRAPVVLVHGYGGNRSHWLALQLRLRRAGFTNVEAFSYNPMTMSLGGIARALVRTCHDAMEAAGSDHLHLAGHSLGGIVVRYAVQQLGLAADVRTAVTVATPHRGTPVAFLGCGPVAWALRPGSPILRALTGVDSPVDVTWVAYYSDHDLIVRPDSAQLDERRLRAVNVLIPGAGHLGILRSPLFLRSAVRLLVAGEQGPAGAPVAAPGPASPSVAA